MLRSRYSAFEEVDALKEPFWLAKMLGYRPASKKDYDRAGNDLENVVYHFLDETTSDSYAPIELLSLSFDFVFMSEIFKSLSFSVDRLCCEISQIQDEFKEDPQEEPEEEFKKDPKEDPEEELEAEDDVPPPTTPSEKAKEMERIKKCLWTLETNYSLVLSDRDEWKKAFYNLQAWVSKRLGRGAMDARPDDGVDGRASFRESKPPTPPRSPSSSQ
nr:hypothetical protein [Tanacetum cinerariifolium]